MKKSHEYPFSVKVVNYGDGDLGYEVVFADFAEVIGVGDTIDEAIEEAYYNLDTYLEYCEEKNISIPSPSVSKSLNDFSGKITVRLPKSLHRDIAEYADCDGMSINSLAIDAFRMYLGVETIKSIENYTRNKIGLLVDNFNSKTEDFFNYNYSKQQLFENKKEYVTNFNIKMGGNINA